MNSQDFARTILFTRATEKCSWTEAGGVGRLTEYDDGEGWRAVAVRVSGRLAQSCSTCAPVTSHDGLPAPVLPSALPAQPGPDLPPVPRHVPAHHGLHGRDVLLPAGGAAVQGLQQPPG